MTKQQLILLSTYVSYEDFQKENSISVLDSETIKYIVKVVPIEDLQQVLQKKGIFAFSKKSILEVLERLNLGLAETQQLIQLFYKWQINLHYKF